MPFSRYCAFICAAILLAACGGGATPSLSPLPQPARAGNAPIASQSVTPAKYTVLDLGTNVFPRAVNASGTIAGTTGTGTAARAFSYANGSMHVYGPLAGDTDSRALDVNDHGVIVGVSENSQSGASHAVMFADPSPVNLGGLSGTNYNTATAISNAGEIVGQSGNVSQPEFPICVAAAVRFDGLGGAQTLAGFQNAAEPLGVNDSGRIAGKMCISEPNRTVGFSYAPVTALTGPGPDPNNCPGAIDFFQASDVNESGDIVGFYQTPAAGPANCAYHGYLLRGGSYTDIPAIGSNGATANSNAEALNDSDWVVGNSQSRAMLFAGGKVYDLNSLMTGAGCVLWTLTDATDINNSDVIVGTGTVAGVEHGFALIPQQ